MTQHNTLKKKTLNLSSNVIANSNDDTYYLHRLLLTKKQVSRLRKVFANNSSANIKLSKTQLQKLNNQEDL